MPTVVLKKLLDCQSSNNRNEEQQTLIDGFSRDDILNAVSDMVLSASAAGLIKLVLDGLTNSSKNRDGLLLSFMVKILDEMSEIETSQQKAIDIIEALSLNCCQLGADELTKLIQHCLSYLQSGRDLKGKWLSLFPLLMSELAQQPHVTVDGETIRGDEYCEQIISFLCQIKVPTEDIVAFTGILRELEMPVSAVNRFIEKLCSMLPDMEPQEVPPMLYQLLFLCDRSSHLAPVLAVAKYFQEKIASCGLLNETSNSARGESMEIDVIESTSPREMLTAKATSIYHISSAAAAGHAISKEFPKYIRSHINMPESIMQPFILEVALSLGGLPQLRDVIDVLKSAVQKCLTMKEKMRHSAWLKEIVSGKNMEVEGLLISVMQQCAAEWDHIVKGLELLAFSLLEMRPAGLRANPATASATVGPSNPIPMANQSSQQSKTVLQQCWNIGSQILFHMIKKFPDSAQMIVQKLVERLQDSGNDTQYIDTITLLVQQNPLTMLDCKNSLVNMLYNMDYRGATSAKRLYSGISPLFRSAPALRETALLVLRKLMHSCSEEARQVAVVGFLQILKHFRYYSSVTQGVTSSQSVFSSSALSISSQATVDLHQNSSANANRVLCTELIKRLQSSLNQQPVVRQTLYESLPEVVSRNPELVPECVKMLRNHLKFYIEQQSNIQLDLCVSKGDKGAVQVVEPLGHAIQALLQVVLRSGLKQRFEKGDIDGNTEDEIDQGLLLLRKMAKSMSEATGDEFELGDIGESPLKAQTLQSVLVALMDFCLANNATRKPEWMRVLIKIYTLHGQVETSLKESTSKAKGKGKKKDAADETTAPAAKKTNAEIASLSMHNLSHLISSLFGDPDDDEEQEAVNLLKGNSGLHLWALETALRKCRLLRINGEVEGLSTDSLMKYSGILGRALLLCCSKRRAGGEREANICCTAFECLYELIQTICFHHPTKALRFFAAIEGVEMMPPGSSLENQVTKTLERYQKYLDQMLSGQENENVVVRAVMPIIGTLTVLSDQLDPASQKYGHLLEWTMKLCKDVECTDSSVVKTLILFLMHLHLTSKCDLEIILELGQMIRGAVGDLDTSKNNTTPAPGKFSTVNEDTSSAVLTVLTSAIEQLLQVSEWALHRIGTEEENSTSIERSIYTHLIAVVQTLGELVRTDFSPGVNSELVLKMACAVYTTMSHVSKRQGKVIEKQFEKLCKLLATNVTPPVYTFISHLESANDKDGSKKGKKLKSKTNPDQDVQKVLKRTRTIPTLIFALEQFSKSLMTVSKRTKVDLSFGFKPGTSRDFRIKENLLNEDGEEQEDEESDEDEDEDEGLGTNQSATAGPAKRPYMYGMSGQRGKGGKGSKRGRGRGRPHY